MRVYSEKECILCKNGFIPTSPKQKYCVACRDEGDKITARVRDQKRSRSKYGYQEQMKECLACGKEFSSFYSKQNYCGSDDCEKVRCRVKMRVHDSTEPRIEKKKILYKKYSSRINYIRADKYRITHPEAKEYVQGKLVKYLYNDVKLYVESKGYKLLSTEYKDNKSPLVLECPIGHEWKTNFHSFKDSDTRCLHCYAINNYVSRPEQKIRDYLLLNYPDLKVEYNNRSLIRPKELDLYFPDHKLAVEFCGFYWHSEVSAGKTSSYHYDKMKACFDKDVRLITVFEDEFRDNFDIVMSRILNALGVHKERIYARKCKVVELTSTEANSFFLENHIQGRSTAIKAWGLTYNDELVAVGSVGNPNRKHTSKGKVLELKRFCTKKYISLVGGVGKLFKRILIFARENRYDIIKSYCDMRYANITKPVYESVGFELETYTKYSPHYLKKGVRYRNVSLRKTPEERLTGKTEWELRKEQGYDRIFDCGHRTYVYKLTNLPIV